MKYTLPIFIALLLAPLAALPAALATSKPNILFILADDLGYGDVGCYNSESKVATPNLDRLASEGMRFTDAHAPSTVCTPSRYSLLTGRMAFRIPYRGVFEGVGGPCLIKEDQLTLPQMLRNQGYATAMTGKWHIGLSFFDKDGQRITKGGVEGVKMIDYSRAIPDAPIHRGFDQFFGTACCPATDYLYAFIDGDRIPVPPTKMLDKLKLPKHPYAFDNRAGMIAPDYDLEELDMVFLKKSREFLEQHAQSQPEKPFFLLHSMSAVHLPSFASKQFQGSTKAGPHGDFINELDHIVGELMKTLERLGMADNTVVMVSSDNGPEVETVIHMRADYGHDGARPWRGMKRDQWEGGHRVPFIVRWPDKIAAGSTNDQTVCLTDVMATCAAISGAALPDNAAEDSFDLLPALLGKENAAQARPYTLHETISLALAIRKGPWKYLDHRGSGGNNYHDADLLPFALTDTAADAPGQLYNLETDPGEKVNLYFKHPEIVTELKALLNQSKASGRSRLEHPTSNQYKRPNDAGNVTAHSQGLHGYIGYGHEKLPADGGYTAGMGFYAAVWPLVDQPLAGFQIGLPGTWILPDNSDDKNTPLAPKGTLARKWKERGPTWSSVFQTVEGGLGYWQGNHFRYGPPKFSMNGTPQCYDYEVGSPGWSFFYSNEALPDNRLGIAQLSNRLLIPPDGLPFQGHPNGEFLGYTWMALPFTDATTGNPPTGDQSWTCFLNAANFKGPIAFYIPETWSKIGKLFHDPFLYGRGLDARPGIMGGGAMEINTVPCFDSKDSQGTTYSKLPKLQFPVDAEGRAFLVQDVTYYSKAALYDTFKAWRDGGPVCSGLIDKKGACKPKLNTHTTHYDQAGKKITGVERAFDTRIFDGNVWGLQWSTNDLVANGLFPQYYKHVGDGCVAVPASAVPVETKLLTQEFKLAEKGVPYTSPSDGAWAKPGPKLGPFTARLVDGSVVTYSWYRFADQPSFQQYNWSEEKKAKLQAMVEKLHAHWPIDRDYIAPPTRGKLVALDSALVVTPPPGLEVGYVPIVTRQAAKE